MYEKTQASGLPEFTSFIRTSGVWGQSCFVVHLASCISPAPQHHCGGGSIHWIAVLGALIHIRRPEIAGGCDLSCLLIWQEVSEAKVAQLSPTLCNPMDWNSPGQNTGVGRLSLLLGIFPSQGSNPGLCIAGRFFTS